MSLLPAKSKREEGGQHPLVELRSQMNRLLDSFIRDPFAALTDAWSERPWSPAIDISQNEREVVVSAEVPGVAPENLEVTVLGNRLTLAGHKEETKKTGEADAWQVETHRGAFRRVVELPAEVDAQSVTAEHANGVLTVRLQKSPGAVPKRIAVKTG